MLAGMGSGVATTVLVLNIAAATVSFLHFRNAGHVRWSLLWPFLLTSVPGAYAGGRFPFDASLADGLLGFALFAAALRFLLVPPIEPSNRPLERRRFVPLALLLGAILGFLAGATGIGGGVFLSPLLVLVGWASVREAASVAAAFIAINSAAGLAARLPREALDLGLLYPALAVVLAGALLGGALGARRLPARALQILLGAVLLAAVGRILIGQLPALVNQAFI